jgi:hypothetical protein
LRIGKKEHSWFNFKMKLTLSLLDFANKLLPASDMLLSILKT